MLPCNDDVIEESLLYCLSGHVDGYHGPLLVLVSATSGDSSESSRKWIIRALTHQGFENRDAFYGCAGCPYSIDPTFHVFSAGSEQNYMYSHLHPAIRQYDPHPKPTGMKGYLLMRTLQRAISLLTVEASVLDVEVWGLGGKATKEVQISYQKREELFIAQRRTIDLKNIYYLGRFAREDDDGHDVYPNTVRREDR